MKAKRKEPNIDEYSGIYKKIPAPRYDFIFSSENEIDISCIIPLANLRFKRISGKASPD